MPELRSQMLMTSSRPLLMTQDVVQVSEVTSPRWANMWLTREPVSTSHRQMAPSWPPLASTMVCRTPGPVSAGTQSHQHSRLQEVTPAWAGTLDCQPRGALPVLGPEQAGGTDPRCPRFTQMGGRAPGGRGWLREHTGGSHSFSWEPRPCSRPAQPHLALQEQGFSPPQGHGSRRAPGKESAELSVNWGKTGSARERWRGQVRASS